MQAPSEVSRAGIATTSRAGAGGLVAGQRPGPADVALAGAGGVRRQRLGRRRRGARGSRRPPRRSGWPASTSRQRDRIVGSTSSTVGAHSIQTVRSVGSSIALSSALQACSVSRSASSTIMICQRRPTGASAERRTRSRTSSTPIESFSVRMTRDVGVASRPAPCGRRGTRRTRPRPLLALQRRGERDRGVGAARPGRAGEQPGMGHAVPAGGGLERLDHRGAGRPGRPRRVMRARGLHRAAGATRSRTAAAISSSRCRASSTR